MLTGHLAHAGQPLTPHDLWASWNLDPVVILALVTAGWAYARGRASHQLRTAPLRGLAFAIGLAAVAVALVSPLDAMSSVLASAHMVQHLLLTVVAAPLVAIARPLETITAGLARPHRKAVGRWRRRLGATPSRAARLRRPALVWLLHVATMWMWHSTAAYQAALDTEWVHIAEHVTFFATATWFWSVATRARGVGQVDRGFAVLMVFTMGMSNVLLAVLMTFASTSWYPGYRETTGAWGFAPLADQQLAGVIMWVPAGLVHVAVALALVAAWIHASEPSSPRPRLVEDESPAEGEGSHRVRPGRNEHG